MPPGKSHGTGCPIAYALDTIGDRWTLLIIRDLMMRGRHTYSDFLEGGEGISTNILANRLKALEEAGVIVKAQDPENKRRILYSLTDKGLDLAPVVVEIAIWSAKYDPDTAAPAELIKQMKENKESCILDIRTSAEIQATPKCED